MTRSLKQTRRDENHVLKPTTFPISIMIGLIDCNNFFVSCERLFRPDLLGKPVVVMSNNDGCAVAMSNEAKALGVKRGIPVYQIKQLISRHNITTLSGNHRLYGDISSRVMATISSIVPDIEIYSIDEAFINFQGYPESAIETLGRNIVRKVRRDVGIPTSIGIAATKTLAKIASHFAKKYNGYRGVCIIDSDEKRLKALELSPIHEVWGIGRRLSRKLIEIGIYTAADLASLPLQRVNLLMNIAGQRTWRELNGEQCSDIDVEDPDRKQMCRSRSFSNSLNDIDQLCEAISYFCDSICRKLRETGCCAGSVTVFIQTNSFRSDLPQYYGNSTIDLDEATDDTMTVTKTSLRILKSIFREGYGYKRAGVIMNDIIPRHAVQQSLFAIPGEREKRQRLMQIIDRLNNSAEISDKIHLAYSTPNNTRVRQDNLSPFYSTRLSDIITVRTDPSASHS